MGRVLHGIERGIILTLSQPGREKGTDEEELAAEAGLSADQVRRGAEWLRHKGLADVSARSEAVVSLGPAGRSAVAAGTRQGLPERRLLGLLKEAGGGPVPAKDLQGMMGPDFGPAIGIARKGRWAQAGAGGAVSLVAGGAALADRALAPLEEALERLAKAGEQGIPAGQLAGISGPIDALRRRPGYIAERASKSRTVRLTGRGRRAGSAAGTSSGSSEAIDVEAKVPAALPARIHPLTETIELVRDAFVALGFAEITGPHVQPSFWNFDALFTPQDHPAREMQDTFYVAGSAGEGTGGRGGEGRGVKDSEGSRPAMYGAAPAPARHMQAVSAAHEQGWGYRWSAAESRKAVLRTHTTCVTVRHLAENRPDQARVFSLGRVFRNEKASYKHLAEFHQVEGVVVGAEASMRSLMGILERFYSMMGMQTVRFWPTFFPYTEPSLQAMAYSERHGKWVELFGMGMLRREVTEPLGMGGARVLAWGGGIERIAMMRYGVDDVRRFYGNDLAWLRSASPCP